MHKSKVLLIVQAAQVKACRLIYHVVCSVKAYRARDRTQIRCFRILSYVFNVQVYVCGLGSQHRHTSAGWDPSTAVRLVLYCIVL